MPEPSFPPTGGNPPFVSRQIDPAVALENIRWGVREDVKAIERMLKKQNYGQVADELMKLRQRYGLPDDDVGYRG